MSSVVLDVTSPCIKVCEIDPDSGLCRGCCRSLQEIADWLDLSPDEKRAVLQRVAQRKRDLDEH